LNFKTISQRTWLIWWTFHGRILPEEVEVYSECNLCTLAERLATYWHPKNDISYHDNYF